MAPPPLKAPPRSIPCSMRALYSSAIRKPLVATRACSTCDSAPPPSSLSSSSTLTRRRSIAREERGRFDVGFRTEGEPSPLSLAGLAKNGSGVNRSSWPSNPSICNPNLDRYRMRTPWLSPAASGGSMDAARSRSQVRCYYAYERQEEDHEEEQRDTPARTPTRLTGKTKDALRDRQGGSPSRASAPPSKTDIDDLQSRARHVLANKSALALDLEGLFHEWNTTLKHVKDPVVLRRLVELVDQLVRHNHRICEQVATGSASSSSSSSTTLAESADETFAALVGVSAWARVSTTCVDAAPRAQQLFELLPAPNPGEMPSDLQANYVWHRRNVYNALLLAWSRSSVPEAAGSCDAWLAAMKAEEATYRYTSRLVNVHAYNYVLAAHAKQGNVARVEEMWSEMEKSSGVNPNAQSYDAWIKAYQSVDDASLKSNARIRVAEVFRRQLHAYRAMKIKKPSARPLSLTLARVLFMYTYMPDEARALLEAALELEREHPECRGLVNIRHVGLVLNALTGKDRVEEAENLLSSIIRIYETDSNKHLRPDKKSFGIVMDGYAQRSDSPESLRKVEALLTRLEERLLQSQQLGTQHSHDEMDATAYNILMTAYLRAWPNDAVNKMQRVMQRMEQIGSEMKKPSLLPNSITYAILIKALARRAAPGYEIDVETVLRHMEQQRRGDAKPTRRAYYESLCAWSQSERSDAPGKVRDLLKSIGSPNTACYNVAIGAYGRWGKVQETLTTLQRMKEDFASGRNRDCRPDAATYTAVLHALCNSDRVDSIDSWRKALECFDDMTDAFRKGNAHCRPSQASISALLEVLRCSDQVKDKALAARDVLTRLNRLNLPQGRATAIAMINTCGESQGSPATRLDAAKFIAGLIRSLPRAQLGDEVFCAGLEAYETLLRDSSEEKHKFVSELFILCKDAGEVGLPVLETLRRTCSSSMYDRLTRDSGVPL